MGFIKAHGITTMIVGKNKLTGQVIYTETFKDQGISVFSFPDSPLDRRIKELQRIYPPYIEWEIESWKD